MRKIITYLDIRAKKVNVERYQISLVTICGDIYAKLVPGFTKRTISNQQWVTLATVPIPFPYLRSISACVRSREEGRHNLNE